MGGREWAMLRALAVLWGGSFFFNGVAVRELPSFTLVWLRRLCCRNLIGGATPARAANANAQSCLDRVLRDGPAQ